MTKLSVDEILGKYGKVVTWVNKAGLRGRRKEDLPNLTYFTFHIKKYTSAKRGRNLSSLMLSGYFTRFGYLSSRKGPH